LAPGYQIGKSSFLPAKEKNATDCIFDKNLDI
jgi:hypothetical protein